MRAFLTAAIVAFTASSTLASDIRNPMQDSISWSDMQYTILGGDFELGDASALMTVDAPYRAHDAATVPIVIKQIDDSARISAAHVVVDENPAPLAAVFQFSEAMGNLDFELRVRVDQYSNVRVIAETEAGHHMAGRFVKASGGCSAPATKDAELALAEMGKMKLKMFGKTAQMSTPRREAQIMIRHPNYSGLQRDQITQLFIQPHFIDYIEVWQGEELLFSMEGGISISENPVFRFSYNDNGSQFLTVKATDTEGNSFVQELAKSFSG